MSTVQTYSLASYGNMIADQIRREAYTEALRQAINEESVVLDIGTGTGYFALVACRFGARHVYAIEPSDNIQIAREIATANGFADRITFIQGISTRLTLPEKATVIVSDLRGLLPLFQHHIPTIIDTRQRLLAPGGVLIPQQDRLWAALATAPTHYRRLIKAHDDNPFNFDMTAATQRLSNGWYNTTPSRDEQLVVQPKLWTMLDYTTVEKINHQGTLTWDIEQVTQAEGLCVWFETTLMEDVRYASAPDAPDVIYGRAFFPWPTSLDLTPGSKITINLKADFVDSDYIWRWETQVWDTTGETKTTFKQSTFQATPLSLHQMRKRSDQYKPSLNETGQVTRIVLEAMAAGTPLGEIAHQLITQFPTQFQSQQQALTAVGKLSLRYSE